MSTFIKKQLNTPILFLVFNRFDTTKQVFKAIQLAKPSKLYVASDGPRNDKPEEATIVKEIREYVLSNIDWECDVKTLFREKNLGCGKAPENAIDWFFEQEEKGIILEDDCLPSESFFNFCSKMLDRYQDDSRIVAITGNNFHPERITSDSYFFSRYTYIWGWATWRRSWESHKINMNQFYEIIANYSDLLLIYNKRVKNRVISNGIRGYESVDIWDYQWILSNYLNNGLVVTPSVNLVKNIGFGVQATHTLKINSKLIVECQNLETKIKHPLVFLPNSKYDIYMYNYVLQWIPLWKKITNIKWILNKLKDELISR